MGVVTYTVSASTEGDTSLRGVVKYYGEESWEEQGILEDETEFTTGNAYANVYVKFKGVPFGAGVLGEICRIGME